MANKLEVLAEKAPSLAFELEDGTPVVKLGLIVSLYFSEGYSAEVKQRVVECFARFKNEFGHLLKGQFNKNYKKFSSDGFEKIKNKVISAKPNEKYEWEVSSAPSISEAAGYSLSVLSSQEVHGDSVRSFLKMTLPWEILEEVGGVNFYHGWLLYLCNQVQADHGYGGLSSTLPYDHYKYAPMEMQLAQQYSGLEVDSLLISFSLELIDSIKGVNWYTVLSTRFVERLGGVDALAHAFSNHGHIQLFNYSGGVVIRAGEYPELGGKDGNNPKAYVAVNRVIRPLRISNPEQLQTCSSYGDTFDEEGTVRWYARFDEKEPPSTMPGRLAAGEPCSVTGYWSSPAQTNSLQKFEQGEIMPEFKGSSWGATFWYWSSAGE
jgi:hypothetical protein